MLQGTLDMLVLQTLLLGPAHGHTIAHAIEHRSEDVLQIEHGSLYPALHRLEDRGWIGDQGADPNKLVMINDVLANTTASAAANEQFTVVKSAAAGEVLR